MIADSYEGQHPAPMKCGFGFADWICTKIKLDLNLLRLEELHKARGTKGLNFQKAEDRLGSKIAIWKLLDEDEDGAFVELAALEKMREEIQSVVGDAYRIDPENGPIRYLPDRFKLLRNQESNEGGHESIGVSNSSEKEENNPKKELIQV